ncbi:MAG: AMMECR1 domain-containing protein, partial [Aquificota bacterium]|nr:AMMECR1 domain-containing protein [Aquificota bacterium]
MLGSGEAKELISLGRKAVLSVLEGRDLEVEDRLKERFGERRGVFVTFLTHPGGKLRGCVGIPYPVYPLWRAVIEASVGAAFRDP